jgi:hypothetical protein
LGNVTGGFEERNGFMYRHRISEWFGLYSPRRVLSWPRVYHDCTSSHNHRPCPDSRPAGSSGPREFRYTVTPGRVGVGFIGCSLPRLLGGGWGTQGPPAPQPAGPGSSLRRTPHHHVTMVVGRYDSLPRSPSSSPGGLRDGSPLLLPTTW